MSRPRPRHTLLASACAAAALASTALAAPAGAAPLHRDANAIPGQYIVVFDGAPGTARGNAAATAATARARAIGVTARQRFAHALNAMAARLNGAQLDAMLADPDVAYVAEDGAVQLSAVQSPVTWGLDRIDQRNLPLSNSYTYNATGAGVTAYVIDTGIRTTHTQFGGRAVSGTDTIDGGTADDCNGHGTHVAGTIGSAAYGVAKAVRLVAVRVLNCSGGGTTSSVIGGVDWVTGQHGPGQPAVANMSLGGGASLAIDNAVKNSIADGVSYAIAAGNSNRDACQFSPARVTTALTVGATSSSDTRASFSNRGACLDLFAPGVSITSTWRTSDTATNTISGTSMAAPHVAGVAALYLQATPSASPASIHSTIVNAATTGVVKSAGNGSPNRLLYSLGAIAG